MLGIPTEADVYVEVVQAGNADASAVGELYQRWFDELAPHSGGWLHTIAGVSADDELVAVVTFVSAEAALRERDQPEQQTWWDELERATGEDLAVRHSVRVATFGDPRPEDIGFVQVVQGRSEGLSAMIDEVADRSKHYMRDHELDVIGGMLVDHGDLGFTELIHYPSADAAQDPTGDVFRDGVSMVEGYEGRVGAVRYVDLRQPWASRSV